MSELKPLQDFREIIEEMTDFYREWSPEAFSVYNADQISSRTNELVEQFIEAYTELLGYRPTTAEYDYEGDAIMHTSEEWEEALSRRDNRQPPQPYAVITSSGSSGPGGPFSLDRSSADIVRRLTQMLEGSRAARALSRREVRLTSEIPSSVANVPYERYSSSSGGRLTDMLYLRNRGWLGAFARAASADTTMDRVDDQTRALWRNYVSGGGGSNGMIALDTLFAPLQTIEVAPVELLIIVNAEKLRTYYEQLVEEQLRATERLLRQAERNREIAELTYERLTGELSTETDRARRLRDSSRQEAAVQRRAGLLGLDNLHVKEELMSERIASLDRLFGEQVWPSPNVVRDTRMTAKQKRDQNRRDYYASAGYRTFLIGTYLAREQAFLEHLNSVLESRRQNRRLVERFRDAASFYSNNTGFDPYHLDELSTYRRSRGDALQEIYTTPYTPADNRLV